MVQLKLPFAMLALLLLILPESCSIFDPALRRDVSDIPSVMDQRTFLKTRRLKRACLGGVVAAAVVVWEENGVPLNLCAVTVRSCNISCTYLPRD
ncbi:unnamed protein product [Gongylonema pulchrum]|uniref:Secreted protein n=1 Tax=Gongylonema pulchrum TaxID=637853 RepID=A0A183ECP3_9BILA|nr:unnamed protein product [Gongylonema pulchrum]